MSSLLFPTVASLLLLSLLPFSTAFLEDIDGDPIINGQIYYIIPRNTNVSGGLTYVDKYGKCPLFIEKAEDAYGTPVEISTPIKVRYISLRMPVNLAFKPSSNTTPCKNSLVWEQTLDAWARKLYITAGGGGAGDFAPFIVAKWDFSLSPIYELQYCPSGGVCSIVGFFNDGLLGITSRQNSISVSFKKAFNVLELPTSEE